MTNDEVYVMKIFSKLKLFSKINIGKQQKPSITDNNLKSLIEKYLLYMLYKPKKYPKITNRKLLSRICKGFFKKKFSKPKIRYVKKIEFINTTSIIIT